MQSVLGVVAVVGAGLWLSACDGLVVVISTGPSPLQTTGATVAVGHVDGGAIIVGRPMAGALTTPGWGVDYQVVAPRSGTLVLGVSWDRTLGVVDVLFASNMLPRSAHSPLTARQPVQAGQTYNIRIVDGTGAGPATLNLPFTVTTAIE